MLNLDVYIRRLCGEHYEFRRGVSHIVSLGNNLQWKYNFIQFNRHANILGSTVHASLYS